MRAASFPPLILAMVLAVASCNPTPPCAPDCGTAVIGVTADADVLFPALTRTAIGQAVSGQIFLRLAGMGEDMNTRGAAGYRPQLARAWTFTDSVTLVLELDPRARWHDGVPVTAADVAFSWDLLRDPAVNASVRTLLGGVASVTARDSLTVVMRFHAPYNEQFYDATQLVRVLPRHILDTIPRDRLGTHPILRHPIGNGPYRLVRWVPAEIIELAAVDSFFLGTPGIARLIWRVTPDLTTLLAQIEAGEIDILEFVVGSEQVARLEAMPHMRLVEYASPVYGYVGFNLRRPLFQNRALRRALVQGLDREAANTAVLGRLARVPRGPITPVLWIWEGADAQLPFDSAAARRTLDRLGWRDADGDGVRERDGRRLAFDLLVPSSSAMRQRLAVILQEQWRHLGVAVTIRSIEFNTFVQRTENGDFDTHLAARVIDPVPGPLRELWSSAGIGRANAEAYASRAFDSLSAAAQTTRDMDEARRLWHEALRVLNNDAPGAWLFTPVQAAAVHRRFSDVRIRPDDWSARLWTWHVAGDAILPRDRLAP